MIRCLSTAGSSPHTRGTPISYPYRSLSVRFIPAYAGNALPSDRLVFPRAVHPRIRGERNTSRSAHGSARGSSPHTRGTPASSPSSSRTYRFIPAYAGNATAASSSMRGTDGSSPHTRGTHGCQQIDKGGRRFIPAYAGNAAACSRSGGPVAVHPRIRGERLLLALAGAALARFIPAYAGNATPTISPSSSAPVHPRIRGERARLNRRVSAHAGSSPHTRGTHHDVCHAGIRRRFIPAYAGNAA